MLFGRYLSRPQWEKKLRAATGAEPLEGKTGLNTAEWWRTPGRPPFTVPTEPDGRIEFWAFQRICQAQGAPPLHRRPLGSDDET